MRANQIALAGMLALTLASSALAQQPASRLLLGAGVGVAAVSGGLVDPSLVGPSIDARVGWRVGERVTVGALFGFYGMNDEAPREGDIVPNGVYVISNRFPNVAQVRTWNGFVQWTGRSGIFIRPGGGFGWHSYAYYTPFPSNTPTPQSYLPFESSEMGLIFTLAAGKEFHRSSRLGFAVEGFFIASAGEDSSSLRTIVGVNVVPVWRW